MISGYVKIIYINLLILMSLEYYKNKNCLEVGLDEVARGCLFGRVYAAAVIWTSSNPDDNSDNTSKHPPIRDSKTLTPKQREELKDYIESNAIDFAVSYADEKEIDQYNILQASQLAMHRALDQIRERLDFDHIIVDGNYFQPYYTYTHDCIVKGDNKYYSIASASILAKVYHDQYIKDMVAQYPYLEDYGIESNMGYGSQKHIEAIQKYGITPYHRKSFKTSFGAKERKDTIKQSITITPDNTPIVITKIKKVKKSKNTDTNTDINTDINQDTQPKKPRRTKVDTQSKTDSNTNTQPKKPRKTKADVEDGVKADVEEGVKITKRIKKTNNNDSDASDASESVKVKRVRKVKKTVE